MDIAEFLEQYRAGVDKVTTADVEQSPRNICIRTNSRYWLPGIRRNPTSRAHWPVKDVDITIPPPPGDKEEKQSEMAAPEKTGSSPEGKAVAAKVARLCGGEAKQEG